MEEATNGASVICTRLVLKLMVCYVAWSILVSCSFHDISLLYHLCFGLPNLLVTFFLHMAEWRPLRRTWLNGLLPCPFLGWHDDSNCHLPWLWGVVLVLVHLPQVRTVGLLLGVLALFWRMTAAFSHWPSTLQSFCCCFSHFCCLFSLSVTVSVISIISACHFCHVCHVCHFCLSFLSCLSYPAMASAISACHFHLVFRIRHRLLSFLPACLLLCVISACGIHRFLCVHLCFLSVRCLLNLSAIHLHRWQEGVGGADSAF